MRAAACAQVHGKYQPPSFFQLLKRQLLRLANAGKELTTEGTSLVFSLFSQAFFFPLTSFRFVVRHIHARTNGGGGRQSKKNRDKRDHLLNNAGDNTTVTNHTTSPSNSPKKKYIIMSEGIGRGKALQQMKRDIKLLKDECKKECNKKSKAEKKEIEEKYEQMEKDLIAKYENGDGIGGAMEEPEMVIVDTPMGERAVNKEKAKAMRKKQQKEERLAEARRERDADLEGVIPLSTIETEKMEKQRIELGLTLKDIASDGNCLFRAFEHQLSSAGMENVPTHQELRAEVADYLITHKDNFLPFMEEPWDTDAGYANYVEKIRGSEWGGNVEISAFSQMYEVRVEVYQGHGEHIIHIGEDYPNGPVRLSFHRHLYTCPHYNSLIYTDNES